MKRIALIIAALALVLSSCINTVPTPETDQDPIVTTSGPLLANVGDPVTITTSVEDDTPGPRAYHWYIPARYVPDPDTVSHVRTNGFTLDATAPSVTNGQISGGHAATFTINNGPYAVGGVPIDVDLDTNSVTFTRGGESSSLMTGETQTVTYDGQTASVSFDSGEFPEPVLVGAQFSVDGEILNLRFDETTRLTYGDDWVDVTVVDHTVAPNDSLESAIIELYYFDTNDLPQNNTVLMTLQQGQRIKLDDGTILEAYLEGGLYEQDDTRVVAGARFDVQAETVDLRFGEPRDFDIPDQTVTIEALSYTLNSAGEMATATIEAKYLYQGLPQTNTQRLTRDQGIRVNLSEDSTLDVYLRGGIFETSAQSVTFTVNGETRRINVGSNEYFGGTTLRVDSASGTETPDGAELTALVLVHGEYITLDSNGVTKTLPGAGTDLYASPSVSINANTVILTYGEPSGRFVDPVFGAYEWRVDDGRLYYADSTLFSDLSSNNETLSFTPLRPAAFEIKYTTTDDRDNTGFDWHAMSIVN